MPGGMGRNYRYGSDTTAPTVVITSSESNPTANTPIPITVLNGTGGWTVVTN